MKHVILTSTQSEEPVDAEHRFVCVGPNCWGMSETSAREAFKNCKANAPHGAKHFLTRVVHKSVQVDPVDGSLAWDNTHDAVACKLCTAGKGIRVRAG
jgi:hypothetical protein